MFRSIKPQCESFAGTAFPYTGAPEWPDYHIHCSLRNEGFPSTASRHPITALQSYTAHTGQPLFDKLGLYLTALACQSKILVLALSRGPIPRTSPNIQQDIRGGGLQQPEKKFESLPSPNLDSETAYGINTECHAELNSDSRRSLVL